MSVVVETSGAVRITVTTAIAAPLDLVWSVLADTARYGDWNGYLHRVDGDHVVGGTVHCWATTTRPDLPGGFGESDYDVVATEMAAPCFLRWTAGFDDRAVMDCVHDFHLVSDGAGGTTFTNTERFAGTLARAVAAGGPTIEIDFGRFNDSLRAEAERLA